MKVSIKIRKRTLLRTTEGEMILEAETVDEIEKLAGTKFTIT